MGWDIYFRHIVIVDERLNATAADLDALWTAYALDRDGA